jgi:hypothetical protein
MLHTRKRVLKMQPISFFLFTSKHNYDKMEGETPLYGLDKGKSIFTF